MTIPLKSVIFSGMLVLLLGSSRFALAAGTHGVISGCDVKYDGAGPNKIFVDNGSVYIDGTAFEPASQAGAIANFCTTTGTTIGSDNTAYYVYYYAVTGGADNNFYVSEQSPGPDGHPGVAIVGSGNLAGCTFASTTSAVFLGSFITDSSGAIVPFDRNGDEVILTESHNTSSYTNGGLVTAEVDFLTTDAYPDNKVLNFTTIATPGAVPFSAAAMILDLDIEDTGNSAAETIYILDPHFSTLAVSGTGCSYSSQNTLTNKILSAGTSDTQFTHEHVRYNNASPDIEVFLGMCAKPTKEVKLFVTYYGYVESIQHITLL